MSDVSDLSHLSDLGLRGSDDYFGLRSRPIDNTLNTHYMDFSSNLTSSMPYAVIPQEHGDGKTQLHRAVIEQDALQVRTLLCSGAAVDVKDGSSNEPLHYACLAPVPKIVVLLLRYGASVNAKGQLGRTPLHMAVSSIEVVNALLKGGADSSSQDERGDTPMHLALAKPLKSELWDTYPVVDLLIDSGCDINTPDDTGLTPFHKILDVPEPSCSTSEYILTFLKHGADVSLLFPDGSTPLQVFLRRSGNAWVEKVRSTGTEQRTKILSLFFEKGVLPTALMASGEPLIAYYFRRLWSRSWHDSDINPTWAEKLCKLTDPGAVMRNGDSTLHFLATKCSKAHRKVPAIWDLIGILLRNGHDPNHQNKAGETPFLLMFLEETNSYPIVENTSHTLLAHGADPWLQNSTGRCAVFEAVRRFPENCHTISKAFLEADLKHEWDSPPKTSEHMRRTVWQEWHWAKRTTNWSEVKRSFLDKKSSIPEDVEQGLRSIASAVLAEKHLDMARDVTQDGGLELAGILRDCRARNIRVDMKYFDTLLVLYCC